ncbi:hypothetical protein GCM10011506_37940 [Marivirga lumbricoides]|uniref:DUF4221 domain-containing protein n=1 Tax=Marivirga lumbricoides TaxID=1046115 RepID=A0ABQ1MXH7_9BACT|nr:hypothetical protein GCM10011506_37940 [Marivirga lumbricoides]
MRKVKLLPIVLLFISLSSCITKHEEKKETLSESANDSVKLVESHDVFFELDKETSLKTSFITILEKEKDSSILVYLNEQKPAIYFYDINNQKLLNQILLHKEGPNAVGTPTGLFIQSMDSIYVISSSYYRVTLINGLGEAIRTYRLLGDDKPNVNTGMLRPFTISPPVVIDKKMYFNVAPDRDVYDKSYYNGNVNLVLNLNNGDFEYFNSYPKEFNDGVWGVAAVNFSSAFVKHKNQFVYSFSISDSIYVFDVDNKKIKGYLSKTSSLTAPQEPMRKPSNQYDLRYALQATYYDGIIYDKYREVYYRFVRHPLSLQEDESPNFYDFHRKPISVIILDRKFNKIGETKLKNNTYQSFMYFLSKDGLYISNSNPNNPDVKEDKAGFTCFKLEEI